MRHRATRSPLAHVPLPHRPRTVLAILCFLVLGLVTASVVTATGPRDETDSAIEVPAYPGASYDPPTPSASDSTAADSSLRPSAPAGLVESPTPVPRPTESPVSRSGERSPDAPSSQVTPRADTPTMSGVPDSATPAPESPTADAPQTTATTRSANASRWVIGVAADTDATFECSLDGGAFQPCGSTVTYDDLDQGTHSFAARATDGDGHTDQSPARLTAEIGPPGQD